MIASIVSWLSTYITHPLTGLGYQFWSGIGSDAGEATLVAVVWNATVCHDSRCIRPGLHHVEGTPFKTCRKHHPVLSTHKGRISAEHIAEHHRIAMIKKVGS